MAHLIIHSETEVSLKHVLEALQKTKNKPKKKKEKIRPCELN
jgi:hypothetical protein